MAPSIGANATTATTLRQALGPGFSLAGPSDLLLTTVTRKPSVEGTSYRR
ncbi:MAG: hypothetical protein ACR2QK_14560 [Acidimicrobiales bacterium]